MHDNRTCEIKHPCLLRLCTTSWRKAAVPHFFSDFNVQYSTVRGWGGRGPVARGPWAVARGAWIGGCPAHVAEPAARRHIFNFIKIKFEINIQFIYLLHKYPERLRCPRARPHLAGLPTLARRRGPGGLGPSGVLKVQVARQSRAATCTDALFCVPEFHAN